MAILTDPTWPVFGEELELDADATSGTLFVFELTSKPSESEAAIGLLYSPQVAGELLTSASAIARAGAQISTFTPDVAGEYEFKLYDFQEILGVISSDSSRFRESSIRLLDSQTETIHVGALIQLPIRTQNGHGCTLQLQTNDDTIRAAELVDPLDEISRIAALDSSVLSALEDLTTETIPLVGTDLQTGVDDLVENFNAHIDDDPSHAPFTDGNNAVTREYPAKTQETAIEKLNEAREKFVLHVSATSARVRSHSNDDSATAPVAATASDLASATVLLADLRERGYERHRIKGNGATPPIHDNAGGDTTNVLTAPSLLDVFLVAYLDTIVALDPATVAGEARGARKAAHRYGFKPA